MKLNDNYNNLKSAYREIFEQCLKEAQSLEDVESVWVPEIKSMLNEISHSRKGFSCAGCGACCRFAVSEFSPDELREKAQGGDNFASQFIQTFIPYESIDEARKIYPEYVAFLENSGDDEFYFYHCPKVTDDNRCPDYENRPQICRDFPDVTNLFLPKTCSFTPWKLKSQSVWLKLNAMIEIISHYSNF